MLILLIQTPGCLTIPKDKKMLIAAARNLPLKKCTILTLYECNFQQSCLCFF